MSCGGVNLLLLQMVREDLLNHLLSIGVINNTNLCMHSTKRSIVTRTPFKIGTSLAAVPSRRCSRPLDRMLSCATTTQR